MSMLHGMRSASMYRFPAPPVSAVLRKMRPETLRSCRGACPLCMHHHSCHERCACRMSCRTRACGARARLKSTSSSRQGNSLLGRREAKPVRSFACSLAIMLNNTVFRAHTAWHATIRSCTLAKLANRAGSLNALGECLTLSDTVAIEFSLAL